MGSLDEPIARRYCWWYYSNGKFNLEDSKPGQEPVASPAEDCADVEQGCWYISSG